MYSNNEITSHINSYNLIYYILNIIHIFFVTLTIYYIMLNLIYIWKL